MRVAQDHPALGVGVQDLDGLAAVGRDDVAGAIARPAGQVLGRRNQAKTFTGSSSCEMAFIVASTAMPPLLSNFIWSMSAGRLDADAAGVERDGLAHQAHRQRFALLFLAGAVFQDDKARLALRTRTDGQDAAHPVGLQLLFIEDGAA